MKSYIYIMRAALGLACAFALSSCDNIAEDERWSDGETVDIKKNVLVEDFTGQTCVNCPAAATLVEDLKNQIAAKTGGEHIISVSIHGGAMAMQESASPLGLANDLGEYYNSKWNIESWPTGLIDRVGGKQMASAWTSSIVNRLSQQAEANIVVTATQKDGNIVVKVNATPTRKFNGNLQVWLTESGIKSVQTTPEGNKLYEHNHVLRASMNGNDGEALTLAANEKATREYSLTPATKWNVANMAVVAFLYDESGVLQVEECHIN